MIVYREAAAADIAKASAVLDKVFPGAAFDLTALRRKEGENFTVAIAERRGEILGAIPLLRRAFRVAPGVSLDAWLQFRVGVAPDCQGMGVGKGLQQVAAEFLKGRGDIELIFSTGERAVGPYNFYRAVGFHDVSYRKRFHLPPGPPEVVPDVRRVDAKTFFAEKDLWNEVSETCYASSGGYFERTPDYLPDYAASEWGRDGEFLYWVLVEGGRGTGYLLTRRRENQARVALDIAVRDGQVAAAAKLLRAARPETLCLIAKATPDSLLAAAARSLGVDNPSRWDFGNATIVKILDVASVGRKVYRVEPGYENVAVQVWTPESEGALYVPPGPTLRAVTIELKEDLLARLLTRRLDLASAVREERATLRGDAPGDAEGLARGFSFAPWAYREIDGL